MNPDKHFQVVATAIILKEPFKKGVAPKYLIMQRGPEEDPFPNMWTVPGGKLKVSEFKDTPRETKDYWYNLVEKALRREVMEESNLEIKKIDYVTSLARITKDGAGSLVLSFMAEKAAGEVKLDKDMQDFAWVTYEEAKKYDLLDGILDELYMADRKLEGETDVVWERTS